MLNEEKSRTLYAIILLALTGLILFLNKSSFLKVCSPDELKGYLDSFGMLAPVIFIILFTLVPLTLFPDSALAIASGLVFGLTKGMILTIVGALCGATLSFYISRILGKGAIKKFIKKDINYFENGLARNGFIIILTLRLIPLLPFDIISYGAGLSKIKYRDFILASLIGIIPGVYVYVNLGEKSASPGSTGFYISIILLAALFAVSYFLKKKLSLKKMEDKIQDESIQKIKREPVQL